VADKATEIITNPLNDTLWVASEDTYEQIGALRKTIDERIAAYGGAADGGDSDEGSPLLSRQGNVGVIRIQGPLVNTDTIWNKLFGLTSYSAIHSALIEAVQDNEIDRILLDINSGGGAVSGVNETATMISTIDKMVKPIHAFSDGDMESAAYWLGSSARDITTGRLAKVGSIGVILRMTDHSERLAKEGIKVNIIRAGKYKQIGNPSEPLSEEGRAEMQHMVDSIYNVFLEHVAQSRGKPLKYTEESMAQGRVFLADDAKNIGLIDEIGSFEGVLATLQSEKVDTHKTPFENNHIGAKMKTKKTLTAAVQAALVASGQIPATPADPDLTKDKPAIDADIDAADKSGPAVDPSGGANPDEKEAADTLSKGGTDKTSQTVNLLREQLASRDEALVEARVENRTMAAELSQAKEALEGFKAIAVKSINAMQVALGGSALSYDTASAKDILAAHASLSEDFSKNFRVGGVAAVETPQQKSAVTHRKYPDHVARLRAASL